MSRRAATFTQADVARAIRAAKQEGASEVVVESEKIVIRLKPSTGEDAPLAPEREIAL